MRTKDLELAETLFRLGASPRLSDLSPTVKTIQTKEKFR